MIVVAGLVVAIAVLVDDAVGGPRTSSSGCASRGTRHRAAATATVLEASLEARGALVYAVLIIVAGSSRSCSWADRRHVPADDRHCLRRRRGRVDGRRADRQPALTVVAAAPRPRRRERPPRAPALGGTARRGRIARRPRAAVSPAGAGAGGWPRPVHSPLARSLRSGPRAPGPLHAPPARRCRDGSHHDPALTRARATCPASRTSARTSAARDATRSVDDQLRRALGHHRPGRRLRRDAGRRSAVVERLPGLDPRGQTYPTADRPRSSPGTGTTWCARVYGQDLDVLRAKAAEVRQALAGVERRERRDGGRSGRRSRRSRSRSTWPRPSRHGLKPATCAAPRRRCSPASRSAASSRSRRSSTWWSGARPRSATASSVRTC